VRCFQKDYDHCIRDFDEALKLDPAFAQAYANRGAAWFNKGMFDKAAADLQAAVQLEPNNDQAWYNKGWLLATCPEAKYRDGKAAVAAATKACELTGYTDSVKLCGLAAAHAEAGNFDEAVTWQARALARASASYQQQFQVMLRLYQARKPFRDEPKGITKPPVGPWTTAGG
jgi:tetratricopeptide (TPR) repeat protein